MDLKPVIYRRMVGVLVILLPLLLAALACNFQANQDDSLRQTDIALGIQQTLLAQTASALVMEGSKPTPIIVVATDIPPTETPAPAPVVDQPTEAPPAATLAPSDTPAAPTGAPTGATGSQEEIVLNNWRMNFFVPVNSGCKVPDTGCWRMNDDFKKHFGNELSLVSRTPLLVDASWPRPYLVFWHRYKFESKARVDISADSVWSTMQTLDLQKSSNNWKQSAIDLKMFKGKEIIVNFAAYGIWGSGGIPGSDWFINDVRIVPNYTP